LPACAPGAKEVDFFTEVWGVQGWVVIDDVRTWPRGPRRGMNKPQ
jgi:hypothetical protein